MFKSSQTIKKLTDVAFAGLDFRRKDARKVSIGGGEEIINSLAAALDSAETSGASPNILTEMLPMASDALPELQARASDDEPPSVAAHHPLARTLLGICGRVAGQWRPGVWSLMRP